MVIARVIRIAGFTHHLTRHPNYPATTAVIPKEGAHRRPEIGVELLAVREVPRQRRIVAEDRRELGLRFDSHRNLQRT